MNSTSLLKSKAFKEREENAREKVRQAAKRDLVADLSRLFGDTTFSDVLFTVGDSEFQAHTVVLRARAPNFCQHFLPRHASPVSVQMCIQINGLEATEFEAFLRSVYTEDDFRDYDESRYPWRKQNRSPSVDKINHHSCEDEIKGDDTSFQVDVDGINIQSDCTIPDNGVRISGSIDPVETRGQDDISHSSTLLQCGLNSNNLEIASSSAIGMEKAERADPLQNNDEEIATAIKSHKCVTAELHDDSLDDTEHGAQNSSHLYVCTQHSNNIVEQTYTSHAAHCSRQDHKNQSNLVNKFAAVIVQDGIESSCPQGGCAAFEPLSNCHFNGLFEEVGKGNTETHELTTTLEKTVKNSLRSEQDSDLTVDHMVLDKPSENELKSCCCRLGQDLIQVLISEVGTDVTFMVNGCKVKAHKAILCTRSNYFSAMLYGDWIEGKTAEIPLIGVNYNGFMTILKYIYGGTVQVNSDSAVICDTLPLVDMYGLEGLREIIICTLKIDKCHMFHKPCTECLGGVTECLEVSELFNLADLKKSCIKWMAKHFDRTLGTKGFATLPKQLQDAILAEIQSNFVTASAIEVLNHCDKLTSCTPLVKWTEPVHVAVSSVQESCLLFITDNFFRLVEERSFHEILKGVGWSVPVLEKILSAVKRNFTIENCCYLLKSILKLKRIINLRKQEEGEECYPEEVVDLVVNLHNDCIKFIRSNLFKVTRSEGWKRLKIVTQREVKEGAVFSGLGDSRDRYNGKKSAPPSAQASSRPPTRSAQQRVGIESRARGLGRGNAAAGGNLNRNSQQERPSSARSYPGRTDPAPTNKRPTSGRPSAQSSASKGAASEKRPLPTRPSLVPGSSRLSHSFSRDPGKASSAQSSTASGSGKMLSSKASLNVPSARSSGQDTSKTRLATSNNKKSSLTAQENTSKRPSSAPSSSGAVKKAPAVSRPPLPTGGSNSNLSNRVAKEKPLSVEGSRVQSKKAPTGTTAVPVPNSRQCRAIETKAVMALCKPNKASTSTDSKGTSARKELFKNTTKACKELNASTGTKSELVTSMREECQSSESDSSRIKVTDESLVSQNDNDLQGDAQGNGPGREQATTESTSTGNTQETSALLNEAVDENCSKCQCDDSKINDSLELD